MLRIENISKHFGGLRALTDVSINVGKGKIHGLIGPNGAGKSTLFKLITKVLKPDCGSIRFNETQITHLPSYKISRLGIGFIFQDSLLFRSMSLFENMLVCGNTPVGSGLLSLLPLYQAKERNGLEDKVREVLEQFNLWTKAELYPNQVSYGDRRRALIARGIINGASLLLLDEPSGGMNALERAELSRDLIELQRRGYTIFIIEHDLRLMMGICDRISVLNFGVLISEGSPDEVAKDKSVIEAYIGAKHE